VAPAVVAATAVLAVLCGLATGTVLMITAAAALAAGLVAHRTGASLLAGVVLALARPFAPGERLRLDVPELGGVAEAQLLRTGLLTTTLCTGSGVLVVPNAELLRVPAASD